MYKCEILADSISPQEDRITTFKVTYPRIIHAEMCRHRILSRNSASSRAIPFKKMLKMVEEDPFIPIAWQKDHKGMQGVIYNNKSEIDDFCLPEIWLDARDKAVHLAKQLNEDVTKQLCNRLLEPFLWHTEIITGTEFENFFNLRCPKYSINETTIFRSVKDAINDSEYNWNNSGHKPEIINGNLHISNDNGVSTYYNQSQAEIHIQAIAEMMWDAMNESTPKQLQAGEWHIPFGDNIDMSKVQLLHYGTLQSTTNTDALYENTKIQIATARCARISYETLGDNPKIDYEADIKLHDHLITSNHWSPFEHCAKVMSDNEYKILYTKMTGGNLTLGVCNNFRGFIQHRYLIENGNYI